MVGRPVLGIIGGLGPLASAHFYKCLVERTPAVSDQDHISVVLISDEDVPSRIDHLNGVGPSPLPGLRAVVRRLEAAGATVLAMPSVTTHAYYDDVSACTEIPLVNMLDAVADGVAESGFKRVAVAMTTSGRETGALHKALAPVVDLVYPDDAVQAEIQGVVDGVKSGVDRADLRRRLNEIMRRRWTSDCDAVLVGCTDISPLRDGLEVQALDVAELYADALRARIRPNP